MIEAGSFPSVGAGGFLRGVPPGDLQKGTRQFILSKMDTVHMLQLLSLKNENAVLSSYLLIIHLSTVLSLTFPNPLSTSAMFGKVHALDCSAGPIPGARDNLLALFCLMKIIGRKTRTSSCLFFSDGNQKTK